MTIKEKLKFDEKGRHKVTLDFVGQLAHKLSVKDRKAVKSLVVEIEASHAGIINGNQFFYLPKGMQNGAKTFIEPFNKPVLVNHDSEKDPIGRVLKSEYVDYNNGPFLVRNSNYPDDALEKVLDFTSGEVFDGQDYKGLGHLSLVAEISDADSIEKILDRRYLTVSIGAGISRVTCSRCGSVLNDSTGYKDEDCSHERGFKYSDSERPLFYIGGDMDFDEVSYVSEPADPNAISRVLNSKDNKGTAKFQLRDVKFGTTEKGRLTISLKDYDNNKESAKSMKIKLKDYLSDSAKALDEFKKVMIDLGLKDFILADDRYASLRKSSYLFADEKVLPLSDKAHVAAAKKVLEQLEDEDGESKLKSAQDVLDQKYNRLFKDGMSLEDALKDVLITKDSKGEGAAAVKKVADTDADAVAAAAAAAAAKTDVTIDYDKLADKISDKLVTIMKDDKESSYAWLLKRNELLQADLEDMQKAEKELTDSVKSIIIDHIITLDTTETSDKLSSRTLDSLKDKLADLKTKPAGKKDEKVEDKTKIIDPTVTVKDGDGKTGTDVTQVEDKNKKPEFMSRKEVTDEYKRLIKVEGILSAIKYLDGLKKDNKIDKDFKILKS